MGTRLPIIALVVRETRLAGLRTRWATAKAAAFRLLQAALHEVELRRERRATASMPAADEAELAVAAEALDDEEEHAHEDAIYRRSCQQLLRDLEFGHPVKTLDRGIQPLRRGAAGSETAACLGGSATRLGGARAVPQQALRCGVGRRPARRGGRAGHRAPDAHGGGIFSDGIAADFLEFNSGAIARFTTGRQRAHLVVG